MFVLRPAPAQPIDLCSPTTEPRGTHNDGNEAPEQPSVESTSLTPPPPPFPITTNHRLAPIELEALKVCTSPKPPTKTDLVRCFDLIPRSMLPKPRGSRYVVGGASPRSRHTLLSHSLNRPIFNFMVTRYIRCIAPAHRFTTYVLRTAVFDKPHRDTGTLRTPHYRR